MKKILKVLSLLLIVPLLGITSLLTGCDKDVATLAEVKEVYDSIITSNSVEGENIFSTTGTFEFDLGALEYPDSPTTAAERNLRQQYVQLTNVYLEILNLSNSYFLQYKTAFFDSAVEMDENVLFNLKEKATALKNEIASFKTELNSREELAEFITSETQVMSTKLKTLNYEYIDLIDTNFNFVLAFCDAHNNYVLKDEIINQETTERIVAEARLKYVYGYFLDNLKVYQHNNLADSLPLTSTSSVFNREASAYNDNEVITELSDISASFSGANFATQETDIDNLIQEVKRYDVFLKVYKNVYGNFDMYTYNQVRENYNETLYADVDRATVTQNYLNTLSSQEKAYYQLLDNFASYDMVNLKDVLSTVAVVH